jgi:hypothetical protein
MATDKLNANSTDAATGSWSNTIANVDEAVGSADGLLMATTSENNNITYGLTATIVEDADTVSAVDIVVRAREASGSAGNNRIGVEFVVGGTVQGARQDTANMTTSFQNFSFSDANWDSDWTQAQLNGAQARCYAIQQGKNEAATWEIDCLDVDIVFTEAPTGGISSTIISLGFGEHGRQKNRIIFP